MEDLFTHNYHNTTSLSGEELKTEESKKKGQDKIVLDYFRAEPSTAKCTSEQVWRDLLALRLIHSNVPKDSIKRACSNLKKKELLVFDGQTVSEYGKKINYYKLK